MKLFQLIRSTWSMLNRSPEFFKKREGMGLRCTYKKGHTVFVETSPDGDVIGIMLQRPLELPDRNKDGKLIPVVKTEIKRRGSKRKTFFLLQFETAKALHDVLGKVIENAEAKQEQVEWDRALFHVVTTMTETTMEMKR